jgi:5-deoxy-D-glucuronate isomerase
VRDADLHLPAGSSDEVTVAVPGCVLYYLDVTTGPNEERTMAVVDDPTYAWVHLSRLTMAPDPRVPRTAAA